MARRSTCFQPPSGREGGSGKHLDDLAEMPAAGGVDDDVLAGL